MNLTHTNSDEPSKENEQRQVRPQKTAHSLSGICSKDASRCVWKPREGRSGRTVTRTVSPVPDPPPERRSSDDLCGDTRCGAAERTARSVKSGTICKNHPLRISDQCGLVKVRLTVFLLFSAKVHFTTCASTHETLGRWASRCPPQHGAQRGSEVSRRGESTPATTHESPVRCGTAR